MTIDKWYNKKKCVFNNLAKKNGKKNPETCFFLKLKWKYHHHHQQQQQQQQQQQRKNILKDEKKTKYEKRQVNNTGV